MTMALAMDPIERMMGRPIVDMSASELVAYIKTYQREMNNVDLPISDLIDRKVMGAFIGRYPNGMAGKMVQHAMLRLGGKRHDGELITTAMFSKGMKWWTDKICLEVQQRENRLDSMERTEVDLASGFTSLTDL